MEIWWTCCERKGRSLNPFVRTTVSSPIWKMIIAPKKNHDKQTVPTFPGKFLKITCRFTLP